MRICGTIGYFAGYNPTLFGALIVDVSNPASMEPLSFIASNPGTRNVYLRAVSRVLVTRLVKPTRKELPGSDR